MAALPEKLRFAFTPSGGYKEGVLYPLVPNDNVGNFDVVRPTSVDRINKDGEVESVPPNVPVLDYSDGGCPKLLTGADDSITGAGDSSTFNSESGVLFADVKFFEYESSPSISIAYDSDNRVSLSAAAGTQSLSFVYRIDGNTLVVDSGNDWSLQNKVAGVYDSSNIKIYVNGVKFNSLANTIGLTSNPFDSLDLSGSGQTFRNLLGKTKSIQHWDYLTDEEMEALTGYKSYSDMTSQFNFNTL